MITINTSNSWPDVETMQSTSSDGKPASKVGVLNMRSFEKAVPTYYMCNSYLRARWAN